MGALLGDGELGHSGMKTALLFNTCSMQDPISGVMIEEAYTLLSEGFSVHVAYCAGVQDACYCNPEGNPGICAVCRFCSRKLYAPLRGRIHLHPMGRKASGEVACVNYQYSGNEDIKKIEHKGVFVGYGVLSSYVSLTRDAAPVPTETFRDYFDAQLNMACSYVDACLSLVSDISPNFISVFNGRQMEGRAFVDLAKTRGIRFRCLELIPNQKTSDGFALVSFDNTLPHDIRRNEELMEKVWQAGAEPEEAKIRIGKSFFEKRALGIKLNWFDPSFVGLQKSGALPDGFDPTKKNIAIFNSSEDEFVSVGQEYDGYRVFATQLDGVRFILTHASDPECHFWLRVHPNLKGLKFHFHTDIYGLERDFKNVTVIPPESPVSSYALIQAAEKVVVFGSTMGIEAAYRNKPVVLLAGSYYYHLGVAYTPKTPDEALRMICSSLPPLQNPLACVKFGYYCLREYTRGRTMKHVDLRYNVLSCRWAVGRRAFAYRTLCGSARLMAVVQTLMVRAARKWCRNKYAVPSPVGYRWF